MRLRPKPDFILPAVDGWNNPKAEVQYDPAYVAYLGLIFDPSRPVVDVGANVGKVTRFLAARTRERVWSFEPSRLCLECLCWNTRNFPNVRVFGFAVGDKEGEMKLTATGTVTARLSQSPRETSRSEVVGVVTLDKVFWEEKHEKHDVGLLKVDTEGHEPAVLRGAEELISRCRPLVVCEVNEGREELFDIMMGVHRYARAVNKYGMTEKAGRGTGAADVFFLPRDWYAPNFSQGYQKVVGRSLS